MAYATVEELEDFMLPTAVPANAQQLLDRASRQVDQALLTQVYDVEDADNIAALKAATLEQVVGQLENGVTNGSGSVSPASFTIGKISVNSGGGGSIPATQATKMGELWLQACLVLQAAGLTGGGPGEAVWSW